MSSPGTRPRPCGCPRSGTPWKSTRSLGAPLCAAISESRRTLVCGDLSLAASFATPYSRYKGPILQLGDAGAWRVYKRRLEEAVERLRLEQERKKQAFKP